MMILVCFSRFGIGNVVLLPAKETFDREFFVEKVLADFDEERARNCPRKHSKDTFLHLDNVIPHQAPRDFDCFGITRLFHPPYSPDLAPHNFWLFGMLKRKLEGSTFRDPIEVLTAVSTIHSTILLDEFISVFDE
jgi:histone-lysine N-methyltransferase SETMAR